jgi:hypothetical protein
MDFRNRGLSSEDFQVAEHYRNRKLTESHPASYRGQPTTETFVDLFAQLKDLDHVPHRTSATGIRFAREPQPITYWPKDLPRDLKNPLHHIETPRDLTLRYWWLPNLEKAEEARLVGLAQSGDRRALGQLFKHFHKFILGVAGKHMRGRPAGNWHKQTSGLFEDLIAAGCVGFCQALRNFDLSCGYRFSTPARPRIAGAISDEAVAFRKRGIKSETDAHRAIFRRTKRPTVFKSFEEFAAARAEIEAWGRRESDADDAKSGNGDDLRRGDAEHQEFTAQKYGEVDRWAAAQLYDCFNPHQLSNVRRYHKPRSDLIDRLAIDFDKRAARRLKEIGRKEYAWELCAREAARAAAARRRDRVEWIKACASRGINVAENVNNDFGRTCALEEVA